MPLDVRLLAIAGPPVVPERRLRDACQAAVAGGVTALQLRWKEAPGGPLLQAVEAVLAACAVPVYVNDRADVALAAGAHGVHLGREDVPAGAVRAIAPRPFRIGISVGNPEEAETARAADVDYWSIGPMYATGTKPDAGRPMEPDGFRLLAALAPRGTPVIAIGGITAATAGDVLRAGAQGIAVSAAIFGAHDIEAAARALREAIDGVQSAERRMRNAE